MKPHYLLVVLFATVSLLANAQTTLAPGEQPQITVDKKGLVRLVFGEKDKIYFSISNDQGKTFSKPSLVGEVNEMHLGMSRGPQLASSKDYSVVSAMDKKGNIHSFILNHKSGKWEKLKNVNDVDASAPEGLMSLGADDQNNFYAVWLDLREDKKNNICVASMSGNSGWSKNRFAYKSPESHVCECCKPSIAVKGKNISIMFRNWLIGSRDLYLITSSDGAKTFSNAQKLGNGTWPLKGCPMDGGGLSIDGDNKIHTAWQRNGVVYYARPGEPEQKFGDGRHVSMDGDLITWESGSNLMLRKIDGEKKELGQGTALRVYEFSDKSILAVWEKDEQVVFKKL